MQWVLWNDLGEKYLSHPGSVGLALVQGNEKFQWHLAMKSNQTLYTGCWNDQMDFKENYSESSLFIAFIDVR